VLDEPSAGLHPADTESLLRGLKASGNTLFVVEHEPDVIRHADWIVDIGPDAGQNGGHVLYSGPPKGIYEVEASQTARYLDNSRPNQLKTARKAAGWIPLQQVTLNSADAGDTWDAGLFRARSQYHIDRKANE
jgi:excinuclease ABC subunit A